MEFIPENKFLEFKPDTLEVVRKEFNLDKPGQMKEAINILRDWVQKQNHFKKKDFSDHYYEMTIITCKGSIERAKSQIDKMCTLRTLLPQFFENFNIKEYLTDKNKFSFGIMLPKMTNDHCRICLIKTFDSILTPAQVLNYFRSTVVVADYAKTHDYPRAFIEIVDLSETNMLEYVTKIGPSEIKQMSCILMEGYGMRIKGIHLITQSKLINAFVSILKQVVSPKIASRIHVHKHVDEIFENFSYIPKSILPKDYGGDERPLKELIAEWIDLVSSDEHVKYMEEINKAATDESFRQKDKFNEQFAGMPGTFRLLSID